MTTRVSHDEINRLCEIKIQNYILTNKDFEILREFQKEKKR